MLFAVYFPQHIRMERKFNSNSTQQHFCCGQSVHDIWPGGGKNKLFPLWNNSQLSGAGYTTLSPFHSYESCSSQVMEKHCLPHGKRTAVSQAEEVIPCQVRHNAPFIYPLAPISFLLFFLCTTFLSDPTGHLSPGPAVGKMWWWDRRGEKRKPPVHTAHKAPAASREPQQVHTFSEKPGSSLCSTFSSGSPRCYTIDHQIPCRRGTRMLQLFHTSERMQISHGLCRASLETASRLHADIHVSWRLATTWPSLHKVKWHQQVKSFLQPSANSFLLVSVHNLGSL